MIFFAAKEVKITYFLQSFFDLYYDKFTYQNRTNFVHKRQQTDFTFPGGFWCEILFLSKKGQRTFYLKKEGDLYCCGCNGYFLMNRLKNIHLRFYIQKIDYIFHSMAIKMKGKNFTPYLGWNFSYAPPNGWNFSIL